MMLWMIARRVFAFYGDKKFGVGNFVVFSADCKVVFF